MNTMPSVSNRRTGHWAGSMPLQRFLSACHADFASDHGGEVAHYIPELGKADGDIAKAVGTMVKRNAAYNEQRGKEIALFAKNGIASQPPSADPRAAPGHAHTGSKGA